MDHRHHVVATQGRCDERAIADVPHHERAVAVQRPEPARAPIVEHDDRPAGGFEGRDDMRADVARAARDENTAGPAQPLVPMGLRQSNRRPAGRTRATGGSAAAGSTSWLKKKPK